MGAKKKQRLSFCFMNREKGLRKVEIAETDGSVTGWQKRE
jgi:hypothetical protein